MFLYRLDEEAKYSDFSQAIFVLMGAYIGSALHLMDWNAYVLLAL